MAIWSTVAFAAGSDGFTSKSLAGGFEPAMMSPLIASQISRILVVDCIWSSHSPKFGPSRVGILNLLISIFVFIVRWVGGVGFLYEM